MFLFYGFAIGASEITLSKMFVQAAPSMGILLAGLAVRKVRAADHFTSGRESVMSLRNISGKPTRRWGAGIGVAMVLMAGATRADIISGLQASYDFASPATIGTDGSGNANHGTLSPANAAWANDPIRGGVLALTPTASRGYLQVPDSPGLSMTGDLTLAAFVNVGSYTNFNGIVGKTAVNQPASYDLYLIQGTGQPRLFRGNGAGVNGSATATAPIPIGEWHFLTVTHGGSAVNFYVDGIPTASGTIATTMADGNTPLYIGSRADQVTGFQGSMDAVRIYDRALSAGDVAELYASVVPEPGAGAVAILALVGGVLAARIRPRRSRS